MNGGKVTYQYIIDIFGDPETRQSGVKLCFGTVKIKAVNMVITSARKAARITVSMSLFWL